VEQVKHSQDGPISQGDTKDKRSDNRRQQQKGKHECVHERFFSPLNQSYTQPVLTTFHRMLRPPLESAALARPSTLVQLYLALTVLDIGK
jgi:hypothetical protein